MSEQLRAAAQQAVDALDEATNYTSCAASSPSMTRLCTAAMEALRAALSQQEAQPVAWMAMRYGVPAQSTTDEPTAIRWRKAGGDVRPLIYADAPPPAPVAQPAAQQQATRIAKRLECVASPSGRHEEAPRSGGHWCAWCSEEIGVQTEQPAAQQTQGEAVTRESALAAMRHIEQHNGPGRWREAIAMLVATAQQAAKPLTPMSDDMVLHIAAQSYNCRDAIRRAEAFHGINKLESGNGQGN